MNENVRRLLLLSAELSTENLTLFRRLFDYIYSIMYLKESTSNRQLIANDNAHHVFDNWQ